MKINKVIKRTERTKVKAISSSEIWLCVCVCVKVRLRNVHTHTQFDGHFETYVTILNQLDSYIFQITHRLFYTKYSIFIESLLMTSFSTNGTLLL